MERNYGEGIKLRAGQDAPLTVCVARFLNMSQNKKPTIEGDSMMGCESND